MPRGAPIIRRRSLGDSILGFDDPELVTEAAEQLSSDHQTDLTQTTSLALL